MRRRDWFIGVTIIAAALLLHAAFPRYEWRAHATHHDALIRVDRWTGRAEHGLLVTASGGWVSVTELRARRNAGGDDSLKRLIDEIDRELGTGK